MSDRKPHYYFGGVETEYAVVPTKDGVASADARENSVFIGQVIDNMPGNLHISTDSSHQFATNGMRIYQDIGQKLEIATAESTSYQDTVHGMIAGEYLVVSALLNAVRNSKRFNNALLLGRVIDDNGTFWGHHESYLVRRSTYDSKPDNRGYNTYRRAVMAHLATRSVFAGAGLLVPTDTGFYVAPAQKTNSICQEMSRNTTKERPLYNTRDEPHANQKEWARLHVISGDYLVSPYALWLKIGTTAIVSYLAESGHINRKSSMFLESGQHANIARAVGGNIDYEFTLARKSRAKVRAVDVQEMFCETAENALSLSPELMSAEDHTLVTHWRRTIDTLRKNPAELVDDLDYLGRTSFLQQYAHRRNAPIDKLKLIDEYWDNLIIGKAAEQRSITKMPDYSEDAIKLLMSHPPLDTRANIRGNLLRQAAHDKDIELSCDWTYNKLSVQERYSSFWLQPTSSGIPSVEILNELNAVLPSPLSEKDFHARSLCCGA